jgi:hypothetical protein
MSVFPRFCFLLSKSQFRVFLSDESSKTLQKSFTKKTCRKVFTKYSVKNPKPIISRFCLSNFGAFLGEGSSKTPSKKHIKKNLPLIFFWPLALPRTDHPPRGSPKEQRKAAPAPRGLSWVFAIGRQSQQPREASKKTKKTRTKKATNNPGKKTPTDFPFCFCFWLARRHARRLWTCHCMWAPAAHFWLWGLPLRASR